MRGTNRTIKPADAYRRFLAKMKMVGVRPDEVTVSVLMPTYNQEAFIAQAIEGVIMQQTTFKYELVIGEDCSTDSTRSIVCDYKERYPDRIQLLLHNRNLGAFINGDVTLNACRGRYIAMCDGDDYWTDPHKLQKQADFLESNPEYSLCCGGFESLDEVTDERSVVNKSCQSSGANGFSFGLDEMQKDWITKTLTVLFRGDALDEYHTKNYVDARDVHVFYHVVKTGRGFYFNEVFGVYRIHAGGIHSGNYGKVNFNVNYLCYRGLYDQNGDAFTRRMCLKATLPLLKYDLFHTYQENTRRRRIRLLSEVVHLAKTGKDYAFIFYHFLPRRIKTLLIRMAVSLRKLRRR